MSSSPPSFVPSVASFEAPPPPPPSRSDNGSSSRVSRLPVQRFQDLRIEPDPDADSASTRSKSSLSLNPLAKEFVPSTSSSASEGLLPTRDSGDLSVKSSNLSLPVQSGGSGAGSETMNQAAFDGSTCREEDPSITDQSKGGSSIAFKRGHTGYSRPLVASKGGSDAASNVAGTGGPGKRGQFLNANHLLNFQYDPIVRPPAARTPFIRRPLKVQPYNKELFLQANFRFLVSDYGDYLVNASDPDKMLEWEDVAAVSVSASHPIQCPICLEAPPVCPQITLCGHIFCFACILRYLAMGEEEQKNDYFKKCPLCFAMISSRALRTVLIDDVHSYQVGDFVEFTLLNRAKGSIIPFEKNNPVIGTLPYSNDGQCHPFSKFTLTSETEMTAIKAIAELSSWAEKVQKEGGEEMDLLPFVFAAIDQLQERKVTWGEHRVSEFLSSSPPVRQRIMAQTRERTVHASSPPNDTLISGSTTMVTNVSQVGETQDVAAEMEAAMADLKDRAAWVYENAFSDEEEGGSKKSKPSRPRGGTSQPQDITGHAEKTRPVNIPSTWEDISIDKGQVFERTQTVLESDKHPLQDINKDFEERESYAFYQSLDGQPFILHPLNMKCLLQQYESYDNLPPRLRARIVEMESHIQTEAARKRYRYLSHLPLTTNFWFCELDLRGVLPSSAFTPFMEEIRFREARRRRRLKQEHTERLREERMNLSQSKFFSPSGRVPLEESEEEPLAGPAFDGIGSTVQSTSPVLDQRKLFSQVTKLGFASAHDAPELTLTNTTPLQSSAVSVSSQSFGSSPDAGTNRLSPLSFADIIQAQSSKLIQNGANGMAASQSSTKKSKKASKVLLSTAGGRRY